MRGRSTLVARRCSGSRYLQRNGSRKRAARSEEAGDRNYGGLRLCPSEAGCSRHSTSVVNPAMQLGAALRPPRSLVCRRRTNHLCASWPVRLPWVRLGLRHRTCPWRTRRSWHRGSAARIPSARATGVLRLLRVVLRLQGPLAATGNDAPCHISLASTECAVKNAARMSALSPA